MIGCVTENGVEYITKLEHFKDLIKPEVFDALITYLNAEHCNYQAIIDDLKSELCGSNEDYELLDSQNDDLRAENYELEEKYNKLQCFYNYMKELYGQGLEVANWHLNGDLEPFDNFFDSADEATE